MPTGITCLSPLRTKIYRIGGLSVLIEFRIKIIDITGILPLIVAWGIVIPGIFSDFAEIDFQNCRLFADSNLLKMLQKSEVLEY